MKVIMTMLIGIFIMFTGFLVWKKKALFLVNLTQWNGVTGEENLLSRIFGSVLFIVGFIVILIPFILN
ncbi:MULTISPECIES: hypothetical protein [Bacillus cereus group]|uniref:hypothetical protein n=1 Tax=Bacillus cereus group TaxID=86661 RepID=UPI0009959AA2|nr:MULTISPECIES: hypothetical protein [Bacillus cereus group]MCC2326650.1 hypothetical protein [Bacillus wiedmannii]OOZ87913.1 hypothetical protein BHL49_19360 [Bacillus cereus]